MAFFKKLIPGKGGEKDDDKDKQAPPVNPSELAGRPATQPRRNALTPAHETARRVKTVPEMQAGLQGEEARRSVGDPLADPTEAGGRIRTVERETPDLQVSQEADMLELLSEQAGLKYVHLSDYPKHNITPELLRLIPSQIARQYCVFPVDQREDNTLVVAISDPLNVRIVDDLRLFLAGSNIREIEAVVANEEEIIDYINLYYGVGDQTLDQMVDEFEKEDTSTALGPSEGAVDLSDLDKIAQDAPVIRFCSLLLLQAMKDRASDLHIEPFSHIIRIRYRVDGVLREIPSPPKSWQAGIISRFKVMAGLDIAEQRRPQDGRMRLTVEGREIDVRLSTLPVVHGECIVMRLLDKSVMLLGVQQIGMTPDVLEKFLKLIERPNGIILVTGPTGCGKTTTLYAAINEINDPTEKIITTEDPVEYQLDGIVQVSVNPSVGLTFARCLRAILRQDPDVILVGEVRDVETAQIAIQASLTGHLVFSTLHTNSAALTVTRLVDMGIEPFLITSTLEGVIGQRLVRMICPYCKVPYRPTAEELADFATTPEEVADLTFFKGEGCEECGNTGYKGRIGIFELLMVTDRIKDLILEKATTDDIQAAGIEEGMKTMRQDGWLKICIGLTTFEEVARHTPRETPEQIRKEMEALLRETIGEPLKPAEAKTSAPVSMSALTGGVEIEGVPLDGEMGMRARDAGDGTTV
ncbi:MAG: GspE/PulE family protein [Candidatus Sumerlaeaceae bacterium]|nr:GspE/PulE family protein [Candidatus Sumerlaeaceae bacterium]